MENILGIFRLFVVILSTASIFVGMIFLAISIYGENDD